MAKAQGCLCLGDSISCFNDILQEIQLAEGHFRTRDRRSAIVEIPADIADAPLVVQLLVGEQRQQLDVCIVALHIGCHIKQTAHEITSSHIIIHPLLIIEEGFHQSFRVSIFLLGFCVFFVARLALFLDNTLPRLVQVILQRLAHVVMDLGRGVCCSQLLTLRNHREDTADDNGAAGVNFHARTFEDFWEVLGHAFSDAMMLALSNSCQVAQTLDRCGVEGLQFLQGLLALWRQLASFAGTLQRVHGQRVLAFPDQPARSMTAIVAHVVGLIAFGGRRQRLVRQLTVVVQIVTTRQIMVGGNLVFGRGLKHRSLLRLCSHRKTDSHQ